MKKLSSQVACLLLIVTNMMGCVSVGYRIGSTPVQDKKWLPYPGCKGDLAGFLYAFSNGDQRGIARLWLPILAVDLPFSFVLDTVCLPYDLWKVLSLKEEPIGKEKVLKQNDNDEKLKKVLDRQAQRSREKEKSNQRSTGIVTNVPNHQP